MNRTLGLRISNSSNPYFNVLRGTFIMLIHCRGTELHTSHDGSGKKVITIQMLNETGGRVESIHMEETGEVSVKGTAKGKGSKK